MYVRGVVAAGAGLAAAALAIIGLAGPASADVSGLATIQARVLHGSTADVAANYTVTAGDLPTSVILQAIPAAADGSGVTGTVTFSDANPTGLTNCVVTAAAFGGSQIQCDWAGAAVGDFASIQATLTASDDASGDWQLVPLYVGSAGTAVGTQTSTPFTIDALPVTTATATVTPPAATVTETLTQPPVTVTETATAPAVTVTETATAPAATETVTQTDPGATATVTQTETAPGTTSTATVTNTVTVATTINNPGPTVTVTVAAAGATQLASTGAEHALQYGAAAIALLVVGAGVLLLGRRRSAGHR
jgi:hypothetical protein